MIDRRLLGRLRDSGRYVLHSVLLQWVGLICGVVVVFAIGRFMDETLAGGWGGAHILAMVCVALPALAVRYLSGLGAVRAGQKAAGKVKKTLRMDIYNKLLRIGAAYHLKVSTAEVVQVSTEGTEQLEAYYGRYLPQLLYSLAASVTLFAVLSFISFRAAVILIICVPLIPVALALVMTYAKRLLSKYWDTYTDLGETFLENLQGLVTLKIYKADGFKHRQMNRRSEQFRKMTMKVLTMQLYSITTMDIVAFGGAAAGIVLAGMEYQRGAISLMGCVALILLSAEFFNPIRTLGSYFHVAMNGVAAAKKIFRILDLEENEVKTAEIVKEPAEIRCAGLAYRYAGGKEAVRGAEFCFSGGGYTAIVGKSGSGKSTVAKLLCGANTGYRGSVQIGDVELSGICEESLKKTVTLVSSESYLFSGTVRDNLLMGKPEASDEEMHRTLKAVGLFEFLQQEKGLLTGLRENGLNFSGGQRQRLALARALLHDSPVYVFDESTSNIDAESEEKIMEVVRGLAESKIVILITHRLENAVDAKKIYVLSEGVVEASGDHETLLHTSSVYAELFHTQKALENDETERLVQYA